MRTALVAALFLPSVAHAVDTLQVGTAQLDRPTLMALGVQWLITDDDNHNATVTVRYRKTGGTWRQAQPLFRVRPEVVEGWTVPEQFAGSIFDLRPATTYEIEIHATDSDGSVDEIRTLNGTTRSVPRADPATPRTVSVNDVSSLNSALGNAQAGDIILIADGTYNGSFSTSASGNANNPIVIRGQSQAGVILDGQDCACNVIEIYGSFVHVERLTIRNAQRALRFQGNGAEGNVVRRVHTKNTRLGFGANLDQKDFYICDNILEGRLVWPNIYTDDGGAHANDDGILVYGDGHVVCHNQLIGFGDAIKTAQDGARAIDFYGNEILSAYDNGIELDAASGNVRCLRNRFTNNFVPLSFQPIFGGPAYTIRNVVVNIAHEQLKFHALGTTQEPSGMLVWHNTFVSPEHAIVMSTSATSHFFSLENNIFVGPAAPVSNRTVDWSGEIDQSIVDYNGYYPGGVFVWDFIGAGRTNYASFSDMQTAGVVEQNGVLVGAGVFASGLVGPTTYTNTLPAADVTLATGPAIDAARVMPNINDAFTGAGPDLGAVELGCPMPIFGVRPNGIDETNEPLGCEPGTPPSDGGPTADGGPTTDGGTQTGDASPAGDSTTSKLTGGCGCSTHPDAAGFLLLVLGWYSRRRFHA